MRARSVALVACVALVALSTSRAGRAAAEESPPPYAAPADPAQVAPVTESSPTAPTDRRADGLLDGPVAPAVPITAFRPGPSFVPTAASTSMAPPPTGAGLPADAPGLEPAQHPMTEHVTHFTPALGFGCGQIGDPTCGLVARLAATWRVADLHVTTLLADGVMGGFGFSVGMPYVRLGAGLALSVRIGLDLEGGYAVHDVQTTGAASPAFVSALYTAARGASLASLPWADRICAGAVANREFAASGTCTARAIFAGGRAFVATPLAYALGERMALELRPEVGADAGAQVYVNSVDDGDPMVRPRVGLYAALYLGVHL